MGTRLLALGYAGRRPHTLATPNMPRLIAPHRLPRTFAAQKPTHPGRRPKSQLANHDKMTHRFVRIYRKSTTRPSGPSKTQINQVSRAITSPTLRPVQHNKLLQKNAQGHLPGEVTAIPNPTPETGFRPTLAFPSATSSLGLATATATPSVNSVPLSATGLPSATFLAVPTPLSLDPVSSGTIPLSASVSSTSSFSDLELSATSPAEANPRSPARKLSVPLIVLLAVGSAILLIGGFTLLKYYSRPTRRPRPKPSRPILDDPFADDKRFPAAESESPIFGGKERVSGANSALWTWSHYARPIISVTKPDEDVKSAAGAESVAGGAAGAHTRSPRPPARAAFAGRNGKAHYHLSGHSHTQSVPLATLGESPYRASIEQVRGALSRTARRVSGASASLYPASPQSGVGLAITRSPTNYTADGSDVLKPKAALERSRSASAAASGGDNDNRYSEASSYEGSETGSPSVLPYASPPSTAYGGRSRIKSSYYTPGSYPRTTSSDVHAPKPPGIPHQTQTQQKWDARRDRDTQALAYALGLRTPETESAGSVSPQPTLWPEDSMSVVESRVPVGRKVSNGGGVGVKKGTSGGGQPSLPVISTGMDASAALGSLMLLDFSGQPTRVEQASANAKRLSKTVLSRPAEIGRSAGGVGGSGGVAPLKRSMSRSDDKPPSIPLPAPLPSLSQMGLEHANPQAYADYRSPTYSIFGLYGSDRKSGMGQ
ncbi:hypothetical protein H0H81_010100 [Sphagnurus paluster]|uniref:Uncharacterized protein n=1 Tax=Sphagnurus paluster TaxID=117069 RepID=A0A9P7GVK3_9AGAR|nr:hypothetical protein H0H81_010100 [Sphagnurus paluster]